MPWSILLQPNPVGVVFDWNIGGTKPAKSFATMPRPQGQPQGRLSIRNTSVDFLDHFAFGRLHEVGAILATR